MRTVEDFIEGILKTRLHPEPGYGGKILPAAKIYSGIKSPDEVINYQKALEYILSSDDKELRSFAVDICLGFFVFCDAIPRPEFGK